MNLSQHDGASCPVDHNAYFLSLRGEGLLCSFPLKVGRWKASCPCKKRLGFISTPYTPPQPKMYTVSFPTPAALTSSSPHVPFSPHGFVYRIDQVGRFPSCFLFCFCFLYTRSLCLFASLNYRCLSLRLYSYSYIHCYIRLLIISSSRNKHGTSLTAIAELIWSVCSPTLFYPCRSEGQCSQPRYCCLDRQWPSLCSGAVFRYV